MVKYPELNECQLGFIGGGNIVTAIVNGFLKSGQIKAEQICVSAPTDCNLKKFKEFGCFTTNKNNEIFAQFPKSPKLLSKIVFICVKPHIFKGDSRLREELLKLSQNELIVVSVMAGITIENISNLFKSCPYVARLMPNTAATVGAGICGLSIKDETNTDFKEFLKKLLSTIGLCEFVTEQQLNAVCGLGGSGIAFVYSLIHAMSDGGLKMGLPRSVSTNIATQTVLGAALMVQTTGKNPISLRDEVTSPGGTTIHGLHALEKGAFNSVIMDAIEAATERANQLG